MWVSSLGEEDPLEEQMATHSSILAWRIPWTEEPGGLQSIGVQRVRHDWATEHARTHLLSRLLISCCQLRSLQGCPSWSTLPGPRLPTQRAWSSPWDPNPVNAWSSSHQFHSFLQKLFEQRDSLAMEMTMAEPSFSSLWEQRKRKGRKCRCSERAAQSVYNHLGSTVGLSWGMGPALLSDFPRPDRCGGGGRLRVTPSGEPHSLGLVCRKLLGQHLVLHWTPRLSASSPRVQADLAMHLGPPRILGGDLAKPPSCFWGGEKL